jgi:Mn2+/Fe2+ NRAMP family transporter
MEKYGKIWAYISIGTLLISCFGAIITEFSGVIGVGNLFNMPPLLSASLAGIFLIFVVVSGNYFTVEKVAIVLGLFELVFFYIAFKSHPDTHEIMTQITQMPLTNFNYLYLVAGNIGAVIMPWMVFYQQSAILDKKLTTKDIKISRYDTLIGAVITQAIMAATLIAVAATIGKANPNASLNTVEQIAHAITPFFGKQVGEMIFAIGMLGASMVAAVVVSLTAVWAIGEVLGYKRSLQHKPKEAPAFYIIYCLFLIAGIAVVSSDKINLIKLNVAVEVMNAVLLPITLGFLFLLAKNCLPEKYRLRGKYCWIVGIVLFVTAIFGLVAGIAGAFTG